MFFYTAALEVNDRVVTRFENLEKVGEFESVYGKWVKAGKGLWCKSKSKQMNLYSTLYISHSS